MSGRVYSKSSNIAINLDEPQFQTAFMSAIDMIKSMPELSRAMPTDWTIDKMRIDMTSSVKDHRKGWSSMYDLMDTIEEDEPDMKQVFLLTKNVIDNLGYQIEKKSMKKDSVSEGLADLAQMAEQDHEVQMARADLYKIAKYAIKLHEILKGVSEAQGLKGWQQAKITKASDYISSVYHSLDYETKFNSGELGEGKSPHKKGSKKYKKHMAAKHASMSESPYKNRLSKQLEESVKQRQLGVSGAAKSK